MFIDQTGAADVLSELRSFLATSREGDADYRDVFAVRDDDPPVRLSDGRALTRRFRAHIHSTPREAEF